MPKRDETQTDATRGFAPERSLRWAAGFAALTLAALIALPATRADAQDVGGLEAKIEAARADARSLAAEIDEGSAELAAAREHAASAGARELELSMLLKAGEEREAELNAQVAGAERRLEAARARLARALEVLADRLVAIYKGEAVDETSLLLDSDGFDDLTTRSLLLRRIQEADSALAARVRELRAVVAERLAAVEDARDAQAEHNDQVAAAQSRIAAVRAQAEARAAELAAARESQAAALGDLRSQVDDWTAQVQEAQAASAEEAQATVAGWVGQWAIPAAIVMCESGGNYGALNPSSGAGGAYQILPSTWRAYGGTGLPHQAPPAEQDRIAALIWADSGPSAWECAG